jgi:glycosyltransferase involved in cell wall biosynthesis
MRYSVITINYNNEPGLRRTIKSVINLTSNDYEYIVIDGGSDDGSVDVIKEFSNHIDYWVSEKDKGIYNAMNKGVKVASGEYCIFMNSGDCFHAPNVLDVANGYDEDIICGKILRGESSTPTGYHKQAITLVDLMRDTLPHQAMFISRELLIKYPYDEKYKIFSDGKFALEAIILGNCSFRSIDDIIADYEINGISASQNKKRMAEVESTLFELFPPRIIADYRKFVPVDDELLTLAISLTKTIWPRKIVKKITAFLLWLTTKNNIT